MDRTAAAERRSAELRIEGRTLTGPVIRYGEVGRGPRGRERFEPGAFSPLPAALALNLQHDEQRVITEALDVADGPEALTVATELREGSAELALVRRGRLRGLSVEFRALVERIENGVRVISKAVLMGVGLVDSPAYPGSVVELRAMRDSWLRASIPTGRRLSCECAGADCDSVEFDLGSLDDMVNGPGDVVAITKDYSTILGSKQRGTLLIEAADDGVEIGLTDASTAAAATVRDNARVAPVHARPIVDVEGSESAVSGGVRSYQRAAVTAILVKTAPPDRREGWTPATIDGVEARARRRLWL